MKRKTFIFVLIIVLIVSGLVSCHKNRKVVDIHNSRISLDWEGTYTGTIPSGSGSGINVCLKLTMDQDYELTYEYVDKPDNLFTFTGAFNWDDTGEIIIIDIIDAPLYYKVTENKLIQLDMKGNEISGKLAYGYVLVKE